MVHFSLNVFIFGPKYQMRKQHVCALLNFMFAVAQVAAWISRKNKAEGTGCTDSVEVMKELVAAPLKVERVDYQTVNNLDTFIAVWTVGGVLHSVGKTAELLLSI